MIDIFITTPNKKTANRIANHLLKKRMIACANIFPIDSAYWWKGKIEKSREFALMAKTENKKFEVVEKEVKKMHPYAVPCIIKFEISANKEYEEWVESEVR